MHVILALRDLKQKDWRLEDSLDYEGHDCTTLSFVQKGEKPHEEYYIYINLSLKVSVFDKICNIGKEVTLSTRQRKVIYNFPSLLVYMMYCFDSLIFKLGMFSLDIWVV